MQNGISSFQHNGMYSPDGQSSAQGVMNLLNMSEILTVTSTFRLAGMTGSTPPVTEAICTLRGRRKTIIRMELIVEVRGCNVPFWPH
eukprot:926926-Ditylum_brightwellii.AAC.1